MILAYSTYASYHAENEGRQHRPDFATVAAVGLMASGAEIFLKSGYDLEDIDVDLLIREGVLTAPEALELEAGYALLEAPKIVRKGGEFGPMRYLMEVNAGPLDADICEQFITAPMPSSHWKTVIYRNGVEIQSALAGQSMSCRGTGTLKFDYHFAILDN